MSRQSSCETSARNSPHCTHVFGQIRALGKCPIAPRPGAHKGPLIRVTGPLVDGQGPRDGEAGVAAGVIAQVGLLVRVRAHVLREGVGFGEATGADGTLVGSIA